MLTLVLGTVVCTVIVAFVPCIQGKGGAGTTLAVTFSLLPPVPAGVAVGVALVAGVAAATVGVLPGGGVCELGMLLDWIGLEFAGASVGVGNDLGAWRPFVPVLSEFARLLLAPSPAPASAELAIVVPMMPKTHMATTNTRPTPPLTTARNCGLVSQCS